jgi:hypothetical protein
MTETLNKIVFEGEVTDSVIADLIKQIEKHTGLSKKLKNKLKIVIIELGTNIVSHHSGTADALVTIEPDTKGCRLEVVNYINQNDLEIIEKIIEKLHVQEDLDDYYFSRLGTNIDTNISAKLGLIRVYKICEGNFQVHKELISSKVKLTLKLSINDNS